MISTSSKTFAHFLNNTIKFSVSIKGSLILNEMPSVKVLKLIVSSRKWLAGSSTNMKVVKLMTELMK